MLRHITHDIHKWNQIQTNCSWIVCVGVSKIIFSSDGTASGWGFAATLPQVCQHFCSSFHLVIFAVRGSSTRNYKKRAVVNIFPLSVVCIYNRNKYDMNTALGLLLGSVCFSASGEFSSVSHMFINREWMCHPLGERSDWPGRGPGREDQRPRKFSGGTPAETGLHRGDAATGNAHTRMQTHTHTRARVQGCKLFEQNIAIC